MVNECEILTKPAPGVMATNPTTAPIHAPIAEGFLPLTASNIIHAKAAAALAVLVVPNALADNKLAP